MGLAPALCAFDNDFIICFSEIAVNIDRAIVTRAGERVHLTGSEYDLLACFLNNPSRDLSRDEILRSVWSYLPDPNTRTVDTHVMRLRQKLEPDPDRPRHFITLHKVGYRFQP